MTCCSASRSRRSAWRSWAPAGSSSSSTAGALIPVSDHLFTVAFLAWLAVFVAPQIVQKFRRVFTLNRKEN